jgi:hypothetical protein
VALATNKPVISEQKNFAGTLLSYRTEYVGDNSKVGGLITAIEYPSNVIYDSFELFTNELPYALTINFKTDTDTRNFYTGALHETPFKKNAILIFALIHNAEYVTFNLDDGVNPYSIQFARGEADAFADGDIWDYSASIEKMEELLGKVDALSSPTIPGKTPLLDVNLVTVDIYDNSRMQISRDIRAAQLTNDWYVVDETGDGFGYSSDSFHPLQKQDGYGDVTLNLNNSGAITLLFSDNYPPQSVSVQRWNAEYAGTDSPDIWDKGESVNVTGNAFQVSDDGNDYIYEVYAKWHEGDSWYVFRIDSANVNP